MSQEVVNKEVDSAERWLDVQLGRPRIVDDRVKIGICREIIKCCRDAEPEQIKIALLSLVLADKVSDPTSFSQDDIENALWLLRDAKLGYDKDAPIVQYL